MALTYISLLGIWYTKQNTYTEAKKIMSWKFHIPDSFRKLQLIALLPQTSLMISVRTKPATFFFHFRVCWVDTKDWLPQAEEVPCLYSPVKTFPPVFCT